MQAEADNKYCYLLLLLFIIWLMQAEADNKYYYYYLLFIIWLMQAEAGLPWAKVSASVGSTASSLL